MTIHPKQLISIAILAAAIVADASGADRLASAAQAVFATLCLAATATCWAVILDHPKPWAAEAADDARRVARLPGKTVGQAVALAAMGWWQLLAIYLLAAALTRAVRTLETGEPL